MDVTPPIGDAQTTLWNGTAGRGWVDMQELLDGMYTPFENLLVEAVSARSPRRVLDVGCGGGGTTLAVARRLAANGHADGRAIGIDISAPQIDAARARAEREHTPADFICADAQSYAFEPASVDMIVSRFGVMFFEDPVRAFANLRQAAADDAAMRFLAWRDMAENPFMTTAERAAAPLLPNLPARRTDGPGQFAFADDHRVQAILGESGWSEIEIRPIDVTCTFPERELVRYLTRLGPVGLILHEVDDRTRAQVIDTARAAFEPYVHGTDVRFTAACWLVDARG